MLSWTAISTKIKLHAYLMWYNTILISLWYMYICACDVLSCYFVYNIQMYLFIHIYIHIYWTAGRLSDLASYVKICATQNPSVHKKWVFSSVFCLFLLLLQFICVTKSLHMKADNSCFLLTSFVDCNRLKIKLIVFNQTYCFPIKGKNSES